MKYITPEMEIIELEYVFTIDISNYDPSTEGGVTWG